MVLLDVCVYGDRPRHRLVLLRSHCVLDVISNVSHSVYLLLDVCLISGVLYVGIPASYSYTPPPFIYQTCLFSTDDHLMVVVATTSRLYVHCCQQFTIFGKVPSWPPVFSHEFLRGGGLDKLISEDEILF